MRFPGGAPIRVMSFLGEHLAAAKAAVQELADRQDVSSKVRDVAEKVLASIDDLQVQVKSRAAVVNSETVRKQFEKVWSQVSHLREEVEQGYKDSTLGRDLLSKLSSAQLVLQDFQGKLSDLLHLESALTVLQDFNETSKTLLTTNSGINLLAKDVANHTKEKLEVTKETIVAN
eukprot:g16672.t1